MTMSLKRFVAALMLADKRSFPGVYPDMRLQVPFFVKLLVAVAEGAFKRFIAKLKLEISYMCPSVDFHSALSGVPFLAAVDRTAEGPLAEMVVLVGFQVANCDESLLASWKTAFMGTLPGLESNKKLNIHEFSCEYLNSLAL